MLGAMAGGVNAIMEEGMFLQEHCGNRRMFSQQVINSA
jgi:hypothetical protein